MTEHAPDRLWSGIDIPKTIAGALAAVCAAVIGSYLGVAGTLAGAAVASVVGSVGTEIYSRSLKRGTKKLETLAPTFIRAPAAVGTPEVAAAAPEDSPSSTAPVPVRGRLRWGRVSAVAAAVFALAVGTLTAVELLTGESAASTVGNDSGGRTTVGSVFGGEPRRGGGTPAPAVTRSTPVATPPVTVTAPAPDRTTESPVRPAPATTPATTPGTATPAAPTTAPAETAAPDAPDDTAPLETPEPTVEEQTGP